MPDSLGGCAPWGSAYCQSLIYYDLIMIYQKPKANVQKLYGILCILFKRTLFLTIMKVSRCKVNYSQQNVLKMQYAILTASSSNGYCRPNSKYWRLLFPHHLLLRLDTYAHSLLISHRLRNC